MRSPTHLCAFVTVDWSKGVVDNLIGQLSHLIGELTVARHQGVLVGERAIFISSPITVTQPLEIVVVKKGKDLISGDGSRVLNCIPDLPRPLYKINVNLSIFGFDTASYQ
jgi:hypothetical protein